VAIPFAADITGCNRSCQRSVGTPLFRFDVSNTGAKQGVEVAVVDHCISDHRFQRSCSIKQIGEKSIERFFILFSNCITSQFFTKLEEVSKIAAPWCKF